MWRQFEATAGCCFLLLLAAAASVDARSLSGESEEADPRLTKRAVSIGGGGGGGGATPPNSGSSGGAAGKNATTSAAAASEISAKKDSDLEGGRAGGDASRSISIVTQSVITFVTVFFFGCAIVLAIFAWKRFSEAPFRSVFSSTPRTWRR